MIDTVLFFMENMISLINKIRYYLTQCLFVLILVGVPLFYVDSYVRIGTVKWRFYKAITFGIVTHGFYIPGLLILLLVTNIIFRNRDIRIRNQDITMAIYATSVLVSFALMEDKAMGLEGYPGWYMGLIAQLSFIGLYYVMQSSNAHSRVVQYFIMCSSSLIAFLVVLNRFGIYPLGISNGIRKEVLYNYVSTIGNINWYAGYLMIFVGVAFGCFLLAKTKMHKVIMGSWCFVLCTSMVLQGSDSVFFSFLCLIIFSALFSSQNKDLVLLFFTLLLYVIACFLFVGCLLLVFSNRLTIKDSIALYLVNPYINVVLLVVCVILKYLFNIGEYDNRKKGMFLVLIALFIIILVGAGILLKHSYFAFNDAWGNNRGMIWRITIEGWFTLLKSNPLQALFGVGPDAYASYIYEHYADTLSSVFYTQVLTNAHNEWLTAFIKYGLIGGVAYCWFFISNIYCAIKEYNAKPCMLVIACATVAYITNNLFSFQTIVSTPLLFVLIGSLRNSVARNK